MTREEHNWKSRINYLVNSNKERFYKISPLQLPADQTLQNGSILEIKFLNSNIVITIPSNSLWGTRKYTVCYYIYFFWITCCTPLQSSRLRMPMESIIHLRSDILPCSFFLILKECTGWDDTKEQSTLQTMSSFKNKMHTEHICGMGISESM